VDDLRPDGRGERFLNRVERLGDALPDPVMIFLWIIAVLAILSVIGAQWGWSAINPVTGEVLTAKSLLSETSVRRLFVEMPKTYTGFAPLGLALTIVLGAGVADQSGLFSALVRSAIRRVPVRLLSPAVILIGMLTTHAVDAGYIVYVPLAGVAFAAAGRHPVHGIILGFIGCSTGLAGNLLPGQYDVLILGITQVGARLLVPHFTMNPLGNWWFMLAIATAFVAIGWYISEKVTAHRFGAWNGGEGIADVAAATLSARERSGLRAAGLAGLAVVAGFAALALWPGYTPFYDAAAAPSERIVPLYQSLPGGLFVLFLATGWAFGRSAGTIASHRDVVAMMGKGMEGMLPYFVLMFFAAHFVAMFGWSNLGPISAIRGAEQLRALGAAPAALLPILTTMSAWLDFLIASGSAKWTALAPVVVPMLMLLGISPEMATAAYRVGDTVTNLISPLNAYFVLTIIYCRRWVPDFRLGGLLAATLPYSIAFYLVGAALTTVWIAFDLQPGPGAQVSYALPGKR
jgi:aminobenzoyl-glutamate transport protein